MKKIIAVILTGVIAMFTFAGCGNVGDAAKEAEGLVTDASESVSEAASDMMDNTDGDITDETNDNGDVSQE